MSRRNYIVDEDPDWPYVRMYPIFSPPVYIGAHLPEDIFAVEAEDCILPVYISALFRCKLFSSIFEFCQVDVGVVLARHVHSRFFEMLMDWNGGELKIENVPVAELESVLKAFDYLQCDDFLREIAMVHIVPRIYGQWYEIRARMFLSYERCFVDDDNWDLDPTIFTDDYNTILKYLPLQIIEDICDRLPWRRLIHFEWSFGSHAIKNYLSRRYSVAIPF